MPSPLGSPFSRAAFLRGLGALAVSAPIALSQKPGLACATQPGATPAAPADGDWLIGAGIYDITGAVAETAAFGYADGKDMDGLHQRLYSHAFVIADPGSDRRVALASVDLGAVFPSVKLAVTAGLRSRLGGRYTDENVMIMATHTHVGTAGIAHETLYQIASADAAGYWFDQRNLDAVTNGIVESIVRADANLEPGTVEFASGTLAGASRNRSVPAYRNNSDASAFGADVNQTMTQLNFRAANGRPVGLLNWFAIHPTAFSNKFTKISGDSKGYAQWAFENRMDALPTDERPFVAGFANNDEGDVVSTQGNANSTGDFGGSANEYENAEIDGSRQFQRAEQLWEGGGRRLTGALDYRFRWVDFANYTVAAEYTSGEGAKKLPTAARGFSFAAGGENGPSTIPGIYEGMTRGSFSVADTINRVDTSALGGLTRFAFAAASLPWQDPAQAEKPVLLPTGAWKWAPTLLPVQVFRIGQLAVLGLPTEATTMSGRRLRATALEAFSGSGVDIVEIGGLANAYMGYTSTREEYAMQHYEGASTEYGPHQLGALQQEVAKLAGAIVSGEAVRSDRVPTLTRSRTNQRPGVVLDDKPLHQRFGQVLTQPRASYRPGETASAVYRGAHPKNDFRTMRTFTEVQRWNGTGWETYLTDRDWDTTYTWKREGASYSRTTVEWRIRQGTPAGRYRLVQHGDWKNGWNHRITPYTGISNEFTVG